MQIRLHPACHSCDSNDSNSEALPCVVGSGYGPESIWRRECAVFGFNGLSLGVDQWGRRIHRIECNQLRLFLISMVPFCSVLLISVISH